MILFDKAMGIESKNDRSGGKRIDWIDCAKGIGMLLVILGHTVSRSGTNTEQLVRAVIFSFHMPLFFILSCITFQFSKDESQLVRKTRRACKHLLVPALVVFFLRFVVTVINNYESIEWKGYTVNRINTLIYSSGVNVPVMGATVPAFGMMWFFVVLFFGRSLFDYLHLSLKESSFIIVVCLLSIVGICLGYLQWLPLSLDIALAVMVFFLFGNRAKKYSLDRALLLCGVSFVIWIVSFAIIYYYHNDYLELAKRRYPMFPLCYVGGISGTIFISCLCKMISAYNWSKPMTYIGRNSLLFFCVHAMDYVYTSWWTRTDNAFLNAIIRICLDYIVTIILIKAVSLIQSRYKKALFDQN